MSRVRVLLTALAAAVATLVVVPAPAHADYLVRPSLDCVEESADGTTLTGHFSAVSLESTTIEIPFGITNFFAPLPPYRGQPFDFLPGRVSFEVTFASSSYAEWNLLGFGVRADAGSPRCRFGAERVVTQPSVFGTLAVGQRVAVGGEQAKLNYEDYTVSYQWVRGCDQALPEVVGDHRRYDVTAADLGHRLQARVTYTSSSSAAALLMSTPCDDAAAVGAAPTSQAVAHVTGPLVVGGTLAVSGGSWAGTEPMTESVRWESCDATACTSVGTGSAYSTRAPDLGRTVRAVVTRVNDFGTASVTTAPVGPVVTEPQQPAPPMGTLAPSSLDFDATEVGAATRLSVVYVNDDWAPIRLAGLGVTGEHAADFAIGAGSCAAGTELAVGASCTVAVRFAPSAPGERRAALEIDDGHSRVVPLRGVAGAAPSSTTRPVVVGAPRVGAELAVTGADWSGSEPLETTTSWEACDTSGCHVVGHGTTYAPTAADVGRGLRALVSAANAYGSASVTTDVVGPVRPAPSGVLVARPRRLDLGTAMVGGRGRVHRLRISNVGDAPMQVALRTTGRHRDEFRWTSGCGTRVRLEPGRVCTVEVRLRPAATGRRAATFLVTSRTDPTRRVAVALVGRGRSGG